MTKEVLTERITAYLSGGGLFNSELADHGAVRDLLIECRDALAKPEQEPVAWRIRCTSPLRDWVLMYRHPKTEEQFSNMEIQPLYTTPPQRKPLSDEEILTVARDHYNPHQRAEISFARAIEAAHGIKE